MQGDTSLPVTAGWSKLFFSKINKVLIQQSFLFPRQNAYIILSIKHKKANFDGYSKHIKGMGLSFSSFQNFHTKLLSTEYSCIEKNVLNILFVFSQIVHAILYETSFENLSPWSRGGKHIFQIFLVEYNFNLVLWQNGK